VIDPADGIIVKGYMPLKIQQIRISKLQEPDSIDDLKLATPAKRLEMMWQLAVDAWAFKGEPVAELRLPRHIVRVLRKES
jgi:hypothetical protein